MKYFLILLIFFSWNFFGQHLHVKILGKNSFETKIIDSLSYNKKHLNDESIKNEINLTTSKLQRIGFVANEIINNYKENDTIYNFEINLGEKVKFIHVYIGKNSNLKTLEIFEPNKDTLKLNYLSFENFMNQSLQKLEKNGFALSTLKLSNIVRKDNIIRAELILKSDNKRKLNNFVFNGYNKFPNGYKRVLQKKYSGLIFNQQNLARINNDINKISFVKQTKYPEILFKKDSTNIYIYFEKAKINKFDGLLGFSNDENKKTKINGFADLNLNNILNIGEQIKVFWKDDGKNQKTFNAVIELPYIFKTSLATKASLNIFTQDSIFQNSKTDLNLGYYLGFNKKIYLGYQETESNDIKNSNTASLSDLKTNFLTFAFDSNDFWVKNSINESFNNQNIFALKFGTGTRSTKTEQASQFFTKLNLDYFLVISATNVLRIKSENYFLKSDNFKTNELYRFGGITSIRGFAENSLQANFFTSIITEYQYYLSSSLYLHSILDYGYYEDHTVSGKNKLLGLGVGFGLKTNTGIFNFIYANGSSNKQAINSSNSIIHISFNTTF